MDPMLSVICFGAKADKFVRNIDDHCFGPESIWARLLAQNAKLVNLNLDCATTFLHYVERVMNVSYRKDIKMKGTIKTLDERSLITEITYFGRANLNDKRTRENFSKYHKIATSDGVNERFKLGRGVINVSSFVNIMEFTRNRLLGEPNFLICGE